MKATRNSSLSSAASRLTLAASSFLAFSLTASAATYQWDGDTSTSWTTTANWSSAGVPVSGGHRVNINCGTLASPTNDAIYNTGTTLTIGGNSIRGLVIGSGVSSGYAKLQITSGTIATTGNTTVSGTSYSDILGNTGGEAYLELAGGNYTSGASGLSMGLGGGPNSFLNITSSTSTATITSLILNAATATVNLDAGTLAVNRISRSGGTGILNLNGGTLQARQNDTSFVTGLSEVNVKSGGAIIDTNTFNVTVANILRDGGGGGGLTKNSAGTLTLTAAGAYTGATTISGGTLQLGNGTTDGSIATSSGILNNAALAYNVVNSHSYANVISGTGSVSKAAAGSITLSNTNTYQGATSVTGGTFALTGTGSINNSSGVTVNGSGAKFLAGSSVAVSPIVTLTNGTLTGSGTVNTVNVGAGTGGIISNNNGVAGAALNIGTLTLAGGANITLYSNGADTSSVLNVTTLTNNSAANDVTLTANNALGWTNGATYTILDYGTLGGSGGYNFATVANNLSGRQIGNFSDTGSAITLGITGDSVFWTGAANAKWNTSDTNWQLLAGGTPTQFIAADDVIFNDSGTNTTIEIDAADVATNTVLFDNTTGTSYSIGSTGGFGISAGSVTKNNTGTVTINSANTYTGGTFLNAGTLNIGNAAALGGAASALTISGGTIDNTSGGALTTANHALTINGDFTFTGSNDLNLGTGVASLGTAAGTARTITTTAGTLTIGGVIGDGTTANGLTKNGNGTLVLGGANTYTGTTSITAGKVIAGSNTALGTNAGGTSVSGTGVLDISNKNLGTEVFTISGTGDGNGALVNNGADQINAIGRLVLGADATIGGTGRWDLRNSTPTLDMGGFTLTKTGANYVGLIGVAVSNPGDIDVTNGTFSIQTSSTLGGTSANSITVRNGAILSSWQAANPIAWSLDLKNGSTLRSESAAVATNNTWTGPVTLENSGTVTIDAVGTMTIAGDISGTGSAINKTSTGVTFLSGNNSYTDLTTVTSGGLVLQNASALGTTATGTTVLNTGRVELDNLTITGEDITVAGEGGNFFGALQGRSGTSVWTGDVSVAANNTRIGAQAGASLEVSGEISSTSNHTIVFRPADLTSTVILSGANTYTGPTSIVGGVVSVSDIGSIGGGPSNFGSSANATDGTIHISVPSATGYLRYTGTGETTDRVINLAAATNGAYIDQSGTGVLKFTSDFTATGAGSKNIALRGDTAGIGEIAGAIVNNSVSNTTRITKEGTGTWVLSGTNTYTGTTTVSAGKLVIDGDSSAATGAVTVANGATLGGIGTVGGATTISGTHAPGNSPGVQSFSGNLSYASTAIFEWDLASSATGTRGTQYDGVNVGGTLSGTSGATFKVALNSGAFTDGFWNSNQTWSDIFKSGVDGSGSAMDIDSVFSAIQWFEGSTDMTSSTALEGFFTISGSSLTWTAVPEPTSALAGLLLGAGLLRRRRRD